MQGEQKVCPHVLVTMGMERLCCEYRDSWQIVQISLASRVEGLGCLWRRLLVIEFQVITYSLGFGGSGRRPGM